jgi:hypothetical protein
MLAICSDLDNTPDARTYYELMKFLNTTEETAMGPGVGLEVGNSIYFDMASDEVAYWNTDDWGRTMFRALIKSGHIDCLHSYGDLATTRSHAGRALDELAKYDCRLKVWVDHRIAPTNFGPDIMQGHGDEPGHTAYHADLTMQYGIQYVWRGRVTSVLGQQHPFRFHELFADLWAARARRRASGSQPSANSSTAATCRTFAKEAAKQMLARVGSEKYALHRSNSILQPATLRDGRPGLEFLRCNPHPGGVSCADRGDRIHEVLSAQFLDSLVSRQGVCILYTHLGKLGQGGDRSRFNPESIKAFRLLAEYCHTDKIKVTTTRRLLDYVNQDGISEPRKREGAMPEPASRLFPALSFPDI